MTNEKRASLIKGIFLLLLAAAVVLAVMFYPKAEVKKAPEIATEAPAEDSLEIVIYHVPGDPASAQLAGILAKIQKKYGKLVAVSQVDAKARPEMAKAAGVTKFPHVVISARKHKEFEFQGLWTQPQVEQKVEEILRGLKRVGADWRPPVPGMQPAAK